MIAPRITVGRCPLGRTTLPSIFFATGIFCLNGCIALVPFIESDYVEPKNRSYHTYGGNYGSSGNSRSRKASQSQSRSQKKFQMLIGNLSNPDDVVRTHAATDLGMYGSSGQAAVADLANAARNDQSKWVRRAAVKALAKIGTPDVVAPLQSATKDRDKYVAHSASKALSKLNYSVASSAGESSGSGKMTYRASGNKVQKTYQ